MKKVLLVIFVLLLASITAFLGFSNERNSQPQTYYQVYLDGELLGNIKSKESLEKYISSTEKHLKEKYGIDMNELKRKAIESLSKRIYRQAFSLLRCNFGFLRGRSGHYIYCRGNGSADQGHH